VHEDLEDPVSELARERFGIDYLFPYQRLVIGNVLDAGSEGEERERQVVLLPTGFGKSICFQLPALLLAGPTLVIYPLLALMEDQRRRLEGLGIACAVFRGGQSADERREAEAAVSSGKAKIIITNPECLSSRPLRGFLSRRGLGHVAIDEAHCVSEWGETFRPSYLEIGAVVEELDPPCLSAFTATASPLVLEALAASLFRGRGYRLVEGEADRPNIRYSVVRSLCRLASAERLARELPRPLIVFCSSRDGSRILARALGERLSERPRGQGARNRESPGDCSPCPARADPGDSAGPSDGGDEVRFYHAGLEREEKKRIEEWFLASSRGILVSTCAYGMGVDKKNIRSVLHFDLPPSVEAYLQESGRAGRDGHEARAVLLVSEEGAGPRPATEGDPVRAARRAAFAAYPSAPGCRRAALMGLLGGPFSGACSGCDRCDGEAAEEPEGLPEILAFARANRGRFDEGEASRLLRGDERGEPPRCAQSGSLASWRKEDVAAALAAAARRGAIRLPSKGLWKGRLLPGPRPMRCRPGGHGADR
jgi:ATP-dependent DNA helicase RecQ